MAAKKKKVIREEYDEEEKSTSRLKSVLLAVLIVIIWIAILCIIIKLDIGSFGSVVLRPVLKDVPVINKILPDVSDEDISAEHGYRYKNIDDAIARIRELELALYEQEAKNEENAMTIAEMMAMISRLEVFEQNQVKYEELKKIFDEEVVFNSKAPDINEYKTWYESMDPENAEEIYREVLEMLQYAQEIIELSNTYSKMEPANAAAIMEEMTGDMDKVAILLKNMKIANRAAIMEEMDPLYAAKITRIMYPEEE
ncbi:MAG: hypothetical protein IKL73_03625 [Lachnospiraceae bacterium]|nr:hypothetical protein [Lachnospira sp.]MBR6697347.1 hypothetical protein [Lachnospiraceae bacterium]